VAGPQNCQAVQAVIFNISLTVKVSPHADSQSQLMLQFLINGTWTADIAFFNNAPQGSNQTKEVYLSAWPSSMRIRNAGYDALGFNRIWLTRADLSECLITEDPLGDSNGWSANDGDGWWLAGNWSSLTSLNYSMSDCAPPEAASQPEPEPAQAQVSSTSILSGSFSLFAPGLSSAVVVSASTSALASEFQVSVASVNVTASESRRLREQDDERRRDLAGVPTGDGDGDGGAYFSTTTATGDGDGDGGAYSSTTTATGGASSGGNWLVAFAVRVASVDATAANAILSGIEANITILENALKVELVSLGELAPSTPLTIASFVSSQATTSVVASSTTGQGVSTTTGGEATSTTAAEHPTTTTQATTTTTQGICLGDPTTWNAGYGNCTTYVPGLVNHYRCNNDTYSGLYAEQVCQECGQCQEASSCTNIDDGATDEFGNGCSSYGVVNGVSFAGYCGNYDDADFTSSIMCCVCNGGSSAQAVAACSGDSSDGSLTSGACDSICANTVNGYSYSREWCYTTTDRTVNTDKWCWCQATTTTTPPGHSEAPTSTTEADLEPLPQVEYVVYVGNSSTLKESCTDTDNGAVDPDGDGCSAYYSTPSWCGDSQSYDIDFTATEMCCACGGGLKGADCLVDNVTTVTGPFARQVSWYINREGQTGQFLCQGSTFEDYELRGQGCCLENGTYELQCVDSYGDGWHGGFVIIDGVGTFCGPGWAGARKSVQFVVEVKSCASATNLSTLASPYQGTTADGVNSINPTCGGNGLEKIYYIDVPPDYTLSIGLTSSSYDSRYEIRWSGACPGSNATICADGVGIQTWENYQGVTVRVYIIIDSSSSGSSSSGAFTLEWSLADALVLQALIIGVGGTSYHFSHHGWWDGYAQLSYTVDHPACASMCDSTPGCLAFSRLRTGSSSSCFGYGTSSEWVSRYGTATTWQVNPNHPGSSDRRLTHTPGTHTPRTNDDCFLNPTATQAPTTSTTAGGCAQPTVLNSCCAAPALAGLPIKFRGKIVFQAAGEVPVGYAYVNCSSLEYGSTCTWVCAQGYYTNVQSVVRLNCGEKIVLDGCCAAPSFTGVPTKAAGVTVRAVDGAVATGYQSLDCTSLTYGSSCSFTCATGYYSLASADVSLQCSQSSAANLNGCCSAPNLPGLPVKAGGVTVFQGVGDLPVGYEYLDCGSFAYGQTCTFVCSVGYYAPLSASISLNCVQPSGFNNGCVQYTCDTLPTVTSPATVQSSCAKQPYGSVCKISCPHEIGNNYSNAGQAYFSCGEGTYERPAGDFCTPNPCNYAPQPIFGPKHTNCSGLANGAVCWMRCDEKYVVPAGAQTFECKAGTWNIPSSCQLAGATPESGVVSKVAIIAFNANTGGEAPAGHEDGLAPSTCL
jgi:hypothetical protein